MKVAYRIRVREFDAEIGWDESVQRLHETLPNIAEFIGQNKGVDSFILPRSYAMEQALRVQDVLRSAGIRSALEPEEEQVVSELPQRQSISAYTSLSRFLGFGDYDESIDITTLAVFGLSMRIAGVWLALSRQPSSGSFSSDLLIGILSVGLVFAVDVAFLYMGMRTFAPTSRASAVRIELAIGPTYLLEAIPMLGGIIGFFWRLGLRAHAVARTQPMADGRILFVVLIPYMIVAAGFGLVGLSLWWLI